MEYFQCRESLPHLARGGGLDDVGISYFLAVDRNFVCADSSLGNWLRGGK